MGLFIVCTSAGSGDANAGVDSVFADIRFTAVVTKDFKHRVFPTKNNCKSGRDSPSGGIESI